MLGAPPLQGGQGRGSWLGGCFNRSKLSRQRVIGSNPWAPCTRWANREPLATWLPMDKLDMIFKDPMSKDRCRDLMK